jgi:hypothetical protein
MSSVRTIGWLTRVEVAPTSTVHFSQNFYCRSFDCFFDGAALAEYRRLGRIASPDLVLVTPACTGENRFSFLHDRIRVMLSNNILVLTHPIYRPISGLPS